MRETLVKTLLATAIAVGSASIGTAAAGPEHDHSHGEKAKEAAKATVGEKAPDFTLTDTEGKEHHLADYLKAGKVVILEWFNPDCPFVKKHHMNSRSMAETYATAQENGAVWLAINSGGPGMQGSGVEHNRKAIKDYEITYPVLLDESGEVGKMYGAKTTPHMFLIDKTGTLLYAGAIDNVPNPNELGDVNYVRAALGACMAGKPLETAETKSYGCSVKYAKPEKTSD